MFKHILVAFDTVETADYLLTRADSIARAFGSKITLVYLLEGVSERSQIQSVDALDWYLREKEAQAHLYALAQRLHKAAGLVETALLEYVDAAMMIDFAQAHQVDLMVLTKQTEGMNDFLHRLTKVATMPILIVQPKGDVLSDMHGAPVFRKILIPLDGSQRAECALPFAAALARSCKAQLLVAHVVPRLQRCNRHLPPSPEEAEWVETIVTSQRNAAVTYLEQLTAPLTEEIQIQVLVNADVVTSLLQLIREEQADLIVLSAHGHSGEPQRPYGSIAGSLITCNTQPVLLVQDIPLDWKELRGEQVAGRKVR